MEKNEELIPKGLYCYTGHEEVEGDPDALKVIGICPYWSCAQDKPEHENGYCAYLEKGDWDINAEAEVTCHRCKDGKVIEAITYPKGEAPFPMGLLWDQIKECGINEEHGEEDE